MAAEHWEAVFVDTAVNPASVLRVKIPGLDNSVSTVQVTWSPIGNALPAAGDRALVVEADDGAWWAVSWWSAAQGAAQSAVDALDARVDALEAKRTVRGIVDTTGTGSIVKGTGFSITRNGTGDMTITFTVAFSDVPSVTATQGQGGTATIIRHRNSSPATASSCRLQALSLAGALTDTEIHFEASGPA